MDSHWARNMRMTARASLERVSFGWVLRSSVTTSSKKAMSDWGRFRPALRDSSAWPRSAMTWLMLVALVVGVAPLVVFAVMLYDRIL